MHQNKSKKNSIFYVMLIMLVVLAVLVVIAYDDGGIINELL